MKLSARFRFFEWCERHTTMLLVLTVIAVIVLSIKYGSPPRG